MDEEFLDAINDGEDVDAPVTEPKPEPETPAEPEAPTPEPEQPAPAEPAPEPVITEVAKEPVMVPIGVLHEVRDELKTVKSRLQNFEQAQQPQQEVEIPDPDLDPVGFATYQRNELQQALLNQTLNFSERLARKEHGAETVEAAKAWALQQGPLYRQQVFAEADPYEKVLTDYKREQLFSKVTDPSDFDAFLAWKQAQGQLNEQQQAAPSGPAPPNPPPAIPPPSLASAPSAGSLLTEVAQTDEEMFEEVIPKG